MSLNVFHGHLGLNLVFIGGKSSAFVSKRFVLQTLSCRPLLHDAGMLRLLLILEWPK